MSAFIPGKVCIVPKQMICSKSISIFNLSHFRLTLLSSRPKHTPLRGFPYYITVSCTLVKLCIVGQRHDDNNNKMSRRLTWCDGEVRCLTDIWADKHISQMLGITDKQRTVNNFTEWRREAVKRGFKWKQDEITVSRWSRLSCFVPHQSVIAVFTCRNELSQRGNAPRFITTSPFQHPKRNFNNPGVTSYTTAPCTSCNIVYKL